MIRVNLVVEGLTEETFAQGVLAAFLGQRGIYICARSVETGRKRNKIYRGGVVNYAKAKSDINTWLKQDKTAYVSTMFDYYALPNDFPGYADAQHKTEPREKAECIQAAFADDIGDARFVPYIQMHEFEGLLFSCTDTMNSVLKPLCGRDHGDNLKKVATEFQSPEHINDNRDTAPSRRLLSLYPGYDKVLHGSIIGERLGIPKIIISCCHFANWIEKMSKLEPIIIS